VFVHPLVGSAIYGELAPAARSLAHARAARVLADGGGDAGRVASHLLHAEPAGDAWAVEMLRRAGHEAIRDGAPEAAVPWLERALVEPPQADKRPSVLHELGPAELLTGASADGASRARSHLADAVASADDPRAKALAALDWGDALWATHDYAEAVRAFELGIDAVQEVDSELALRIEAHAMAAARLDLGTCGLISTRLERFRNGPPATPAGRLLAGVLAIDRALAGEPRPEVIALAERMLEGGSLPAGRVGAQIPLFATNALLWSDHLDDARLLLDELVARARAAGSVRGAMIGLCWRGVAAHRVGALADAMSDLATAVELGAEQGAGATAATHALLAECSSTSVKVDEAARTLPPIPNHDELPDYIGWNYVLYARGAVHAARLEFARALDDFLACGDRQERWRACHPSVLPWRSQAAVAQLALGDRARALDLAEEELWLARRFGAPRAIGVALRTLGLIERGGRRLELLREAVSVLEGSSARLAHAHALTDLGGALRPANARRAAGHRRTTTQRHSHRRGRAHPDRAPTGRPGRRRHVEPADRPGALHLAQDRRETPQRRLPQPRHPARGPSSQPRWTGPRRNRREPPRRSAPREDV
jgi:tetratricopeptide (TPR) repeat protein